MYKLVKMAIPSGWEMVINNFLYINLSEIKKNNKICLNLTQDIMYIQRKRKKVTLGIDLGWYPETEPTGQYCIKVIKNDDWEKPIEIYENRDIDDIINKIEMLLIKYSKDYNYVK